MTADNRSYPQHDTVELRRILDYLARLGPAPWEFAGTSDEGVTINAGKQVILHGHWPAVLYAKLACKAVNALPALLDVVTAVKEWRTIPAGTVHDNEVTAAMCRIFDAMDALEGATAHKGE